MNARQILAAVASAAALTAATAGAQQQTQPQQARPQPQQAPLQQAQPQQARPQQAQPAGAQQSGQEPVRGGEWLGAARPGAVDNIGLSQVQVRQLQRALDAQGCSPGPIDGLLGPGTRQAIECVRQRHNLTESEPNELLRVLNVGFVLPERRGTQPGQMRPAVVPQPAAAPPGQQPQGTVPRTVEDRRDPTRVEDRRDRTRTEIRADTGRTAAPPPR